MRRTFEAKGIKAQRHVGKAHWYPHVAVGPRGEGTQWRNEINEAGEVWGSEIIMNIYIIYEDFLLQKIC